MYSSVRINEWLIRLLDPDSRRERMMTRLDYGFCGTVAFSGLPPKRRIES